MMWILFSQISAVAESATTILAKKNMLKFDSIVVTWLWVTSSLVVLLTLLAFTGIPEIKEGFIIVLIARVVLDTAALLLYTKAIQLEDISLITPLYNFSAIFTLTFSFIFNKELPKAVGILGILLIVLGAYLLNYESKNKNLFHPILNIIKNKGSLYMIISTILYGIIFSISKIGIETSSWSFYTFASALGLSITILPIAIWRKKEDLKEIIKLKHAIKVFPLGFVDAIKILALMATISTSFVSFADAANNTSIIYNLGLGKFFFGEKIKQRIIPVIFMFAGLALIVIS